MEHSSGERSDAFRASDPATGDLSGRVGAHDSAPDSMPVRNADSTTESASLTGDATAAALRPGSGWFRARWPKGGRSPGRGAAVASSAGDFAGGNLRWLTQLPTAPTARAREACSRMSESLSARLDAEGVRIPRPAFPSARLSAWKSPAFSRTALAVVELSPAMVRFDLVLVPQGNLPTVTLRLEVGATGRSMLWFDGWCSGAELGRTARSAFAPLATHFAAAAAMLGASRPSPPWIAALSCGGGIVRSQRPIDAVLRETAALAHLALDFVPRVDPTSCAAPESSGTELRPGPLGAAHRTMADALRAHDPWRRVIRLRYGAPFLADYDTLRFDDVEGR